MGEPISQRNVDGALKEMARELSEYSTRNAEKAKLEEFPKIEPEAKVDPFSFLN